MTIRSKENLENNTPPVHGSSEYIDTLLRQLPDDEKKALLEKHVQQSLPMVVEDKDENKLANINYQEHGLNISEFHFVLEYFNNGYNALQAYLTVHPDVRWESAKTLGHSTIHRPYVKQFISLCMNAMGMTNVELERRLEALIEADPLDCFDFDENGKIIRFNAIKAKRTGMSPLIKGFKQTKFGVEVSFVPFDKLMDIATKVRGMQKKISITGDLHKIAEGNDLPVDDIVDMVSVVRKQIKPAVIARFDNGIEIYQDDS